MRQTNVCHTEVSYNGAISLIDCIDWHSQHKTATHTITLSRAFSVRWLLRSKSKWHNRPKCRSDKLKIMMLFLDPGKNSKITFAACIFFFNIQSIGTYLPSSQVSTIFHLISISFFFISLFLNLLT